MKYTETHEWVALSEETGTVGITTYAQKELGDVVYIELPKIGQEVKAGEDVAVLESTKAAVDIASPVSGTVIALNEKAVESINQDPQGEGWLFKVKVTHQRELQDLLDLSEYKRLVNINL
jgi:glycine cleavage system H protein